MWFVPLEVDFLFINLSCSCCSLLCQNNEMQPWFPFFWVRSWQRVTFSALRAAGVTSSQRIRPSVSYGNSLVCCGCCFDFLVIGILYMSVKTNTIFPTTTQILCNPSSIMSSPGMTHFLQLWSPETITKAAAEWFNSEVFPASPSVAYFSWVSIFFAFPIVWVFYI